MKGKPKYKMGQKVKTQINGQWHEGEIFIIDEYGTFEDNSDVSYDIMVHDFVMPGKTEPGDCLVKHRREDYVFKV